MRKLILQWKFLVILLASFLVMTACSDNKPESEKESTSGVEEKTYENNGLLVTVDWLKENLDNEDLLILDARGEDEYSKGHVPGAISVSWQQFSNMNGNPGDEDWGVVLEAAELSQRLSEIGLSTEKTVVVYGNPNAWGEDGRILWMLQMAGVNGKMLDGGWPVWKTSGEVTKDATEPVPSQFSVNELDFTMFAATDWLSENYDELVVIDTRTEKEFDGATDFGEARGGHIPGSINLPFKELYNNDATIKTQADIEAIMNELGVNKEDAIVTYCTAGIRSAHMALILYMAGYENVKNYDASFYEWATNDVLPLD